MAVSRRTSQDMVPVIEAYLESDLTQRAFCSERDLNPSMFGYWLARYRRNVVGRGPGGVRSPADRLYSESHE